MIKPEGQTCLMCGMCCKAIVIGESHYSIKKHVLRTFPFLTKEELKEKAFNNDYVFIDMYLKPITHEEAYKINPHLKTWNLSENNYTYKCPFVSKDNRCKVHDKKKQGGMCEGFPWYKSQPYNAEWYNPNCPYKEDEPLEDV